MSFLRRLFCQHLWSWLRTIHGDEINARGGKRTVFVCDKCGKIMYHDDYITKEMAFRIHGEQAMTTDNDKAAPKDDISKFHGQMQKVSEDLGFSPAKPVVDDAMVERAMRAHMRYEIFSTESMRAALVAALEGRT